MSLGCAGPQEMLFKTAIHGSWLLGKLQGELGRQYVVRRRFVYLGPI